MTDQLPPGARALLDEAVEKAALHFMVEQYAGGTDAQARGAAREAWLGVSESVREAYRAKASRVLAAAGFLDLAARAELAERDMRQIDFVLDAADVPTEQYAAQGGGVCGLTRAGRVDWLKGQREPDVEMRATVALVSKQCADLRGEVERLNRRNEELEEAIRRTLGHGSGVYGRTELEAALHQSRSSGGSS